MTTTFEITSNANYESVFYLVKHRVNLGNQLVPGEREAVVPALLRPGHMSPGGSIQARALIKGQWINAENYFSGLGSPALWHSYGNGDLLWLGLPDGWYYTNRNMIVSFNRDHVLFKDGSSLQGEFALSFWAGIEEKDKSQLYYRIVEEKNGSVTFHKVNGSRAVTGSPSQEEPGIHTYVGGSGPAFDSPIANRTPYKILVKKGYSTGANRCADPIFVHPGCILKLSLEGGAYSFSHWREKPIAPENVKEAETILVWDEEHREIVVYERPLTRWQVEYRTSIQDALERQVCNA